MCNVFGLFTQSTSCITTINFYSYFLSLAIPLMMLPDFSTTKVIVISFFFSCSPSLENHHIHHCCHHSKANVIHVCMSVPFKSQLQPQHNDLWRKGKYFLAVVQVFPVIRKERQGEEVIYKDDGSTVL